jgi:hypothetical protein
VWTSQRTLLETIRTMLFQLFSDNLAVVLDFLTLQDKHNIRTFLVNIKSIDGRTDRGKTEYPPPVERGYNNTKVYFAPFICTQSTQ